MRAKDVMVEKFVFFHEDDSINTIIRTFMSTKETSIPVLDEEKKLVGIIFEKDIYKYLNPDLPEEAFEFDVFFEAFKENQLVNRIRKLKEEENKTFIQKDDLLTIDPEDVIEEVISLFSRTDLEQLPVITKTRRVIGVLRRKDLLHILLLND